MARFSDKDIAAAVDAFVANTPARSAPAVGKNSDVVIYGDNPNPYRPPMPVKGEENEPVQAISRDDIGIELSGLD
jgi:hypothetical protein